MQMMLNLNIPSHNNLNDLINKLGLEINNKTQRYTEDELLQLHADMVTNIREIIFK